MWHIDLFSPLAVLPVAGIAPGQFVHGGLAFDAALDSIAPDPPQPKPK